MTKFAVIASLLLLVSINTAHSSDRLAISGFARIVAGYFDDDTQQFRGYTNSVSLTEDSLFALRADYSLSDTLSFTAQGIATASKARDSGIQWLYADYRPNRDWTLKLGRQRVPFFQYSDVVDVGFAYPWLTLPVPVYNGFIFTEFDGGLVRNDFSVGQTFGHVELYYGAYDGDIRNYDGRISADVDNIFGGVLSLSHNKLSLRASLHRGDVKITQENLAQFINVLQLSGFAESARTLQIDNIVTIAQLGFSYENLNYFIRGEYTDVASDDYLVGERKATYLTAGFHHKNMTYHLTYSIGEHDNVEPANELMFGLSQQLDQLAFGYQSAIDAVANDSGDIITLGLRYDYSANLAFKSEVLFLDGDNNSTGYLETSQPVPEGSSGSLYQFAIEWVF